MLQSDSSFGNGPASILYKSIAGRYRPVSYPDGPITAGYRFFKNVYWGSDSVANVSLVCCVCSVCGTLFSLPHGVIGYVL